MFRAIFLLTIFFSTLSIEAKPPQLTPRDTRIKIEEILKAHVSHQSLTEELVGRALSNYLEELDPMKTYLLESEIDAWINPSQQFLAETLRRYNKEDFSPFEMMFDQMVSAIKRRNSIEKELENTTLVKNVQSSEFKDLAWANSSKDLTNRLLRIKSLQVQTAEKINLESKDQFLQRLTKRRLKNESEFLNCSATEKQQLILSYVLKATSSALDSQTLYFTPSEAGHFMMQVQQKLSGIGAQLRDDLVGFSVMHIVEGSPASASNKLKVGDRIIAVDNEPVVGMDIVEAVELIRGPQGSHVSLTILRDTKENEVTTQEKLDVDLIRGEIVLKDARLTSSYEPYGDGAIGVIQLFSFYHDGNNSSSSDVAEAIEKLKKEHNLKGIILDLRNNSGGLLPQAVSVSGLFLSKGIVVSIKDNTDEVHHLRNIESKKIWDGPLVVLTARTSASAAEIVAQALQDYGRAVVVGDPETFGKGTFQIFTMESTNFGKVNPKGEYKVTRGRYYTVSGKSPQLVGVKADIVVPGMFSQMEIGEKYAKFPVGTDQIQPNFDDTLSDVPVIHRAQLNRIYKQDLQPILTTYQPYVEYLKTNSEERIAQNKNYQNFLKEISKKDSFSESSDFFGQNDLQLIETTNIMKDLIYFMQLGEKPSPKAA